MRVHVAVFMFAYYIMSIYQVLLQPQRGDTKLTKSIQESLKRFGTQNLQKVLYACSAAYHLCLALVLPIAHRQELHCS
jgi:hypothetical protein